MNTAFLFCITSILFFTNWCYGQDDGRKLSSQNNFDLTQNEILAEADYLYSHCKKSELLQTVYREKYNPSFQTGSLAYINENKETGIVFHLNADSLSILMSAELKNDTILSLDTNRKLQSGTEKILCNIYKNAYASASLWSQWSNLTNVDFWIVIRSTEKGFKAFVLTKLLNDSMLAFGNDFILSYNSKGVFKDFRTIHNNFIPIPLQIGFDENGLKGDIHSHSNKSSDFMTATDVCILKLYKEKLITKRHFVMSRKYVTEFNTETGQLIIQTKEDFILKEGIKNLD